jgi:hypothetical protein
MSNLAPGHVEGRIGLCRCHPDGSRGEPLWIADSGRPGSGPRWCCGNCRTWEWEQDQIGEVVERRDEAKGTRVYRVYAHPLLSRSLD